MCFSPQRRTIIRHQNVQKCSEDYSFLTFSLPNVPFATAACIFSTSARTKVVQTRHVLKIFTSKCAFRHSGVQFFDIRTSRSASNTSCFVHFHFRMCFFATAAYNFSTSELQEVLRTHHVLYIFTSECAFRHSGVQFWMSPLTTYLRTRRFNGPTFRLTRHTNH